jgi:two-component system, LytTR family, response regulator
MYTCIIIDDQQAAVDLIKDHVLKIPMLSIQLMTTDAIAALAFLDSNKPDIIFLDIEMPGITGIEFIVNLKSRWGNNLPKLVFTTGYTQYALEGYEHGVADYLLKPITFSRFKQCTDRIIDDIDKHNVGSVTQNFFFADEKGIKTKINYDDVVYVEAAGNYIIIAFFDNNKILYKSMGSIQELLPADKFVRIHKSYIVSINKIQAVKGSEVIVKMKDGDKFLPIGITNKENVLKLLGIN